MKRKLTLAMWLSLSAASPAALALGLGQAEVHSTLNAPLRASVALTDTAGLQAGLLNVSVADERAFTAAGLTRTPLAASVRAAVVERQGRLVLELTTERSVREPWLDLLVRFDWPGGQQLREVTLLLDPPDYDRMPALVVGSRPRVAATSASPAPPRETAPTPRPAAPAGDPAWVRSGDTLWAVAGRLRPDSGISMSQMMVALVEANPEVFPSGNINDMRAGFTLVVPGRETLAVRSSAEADRLVQAMNQAWASRGRGAPAPVSLTPVAAVPEPAPEVTVPSSSEPDPELAMEAAPDEVAPAVVTADEATGEVEAPHLTLLTDAQLAAETAADPRDSGGEEGGATTSGEGLAEAAVTAALAVAVSEAMDEAGTEGAAPESRLARLERRWQESEQALEAVREERDALQEALGEMRDELAALREELALLMAGGAGAEGAGASGIVPPGGEAEESPWWGGLYQGELDRNLMLGGAGLAALLALWLVVRRRRRHEEAVAGGFGEARVVRPSVAVTGTAAATMPSDAAPTAPPPASVRATLPQAEAISEADIFIAYGRHDQARELLESHLAREPERADLRLKLLGVLLQQGDRQAAREEAARLRDGGDAELRHEAQRLMTLHGLAGGEGLAREAASEGGAGQEASVAPQVAPQAPPERQADSPQGPAQGSDASDEGGLPPLKPRPRDGGGEIIDYQPPPLEPDPRPREETPMQPGVEFTPGDASAMGAAPGERPTPLPADWEVEEVAFPRLDRDNAGSSTETSPSEDLAEARRLLEAGEGDRARGLLETLTAHHEASVREEARALMIRLDA